MIPIAAGGGDYTFLVIMLVIGLINWLVSKMKGIAPVPPANPRRPSAQPARSRPQASGDSEEERTRRFLEALGVPAGEPAPPPRPAQPAVARRRAMAPPPLPPPRRVPQSLDEEDAPTLPVEQIALRDLEVPDVPEFATVSSRVSAIPAGAYQPASRGDAPAPSASGADPRMADLLATLRTPATLRQAFVMREILGPPRSLQS